MKKARFIAVAISLCMALTVGAFATSCSGGSAAAKDGKATAQEVYDGISKTFSNYFSSDFTSADNEKMVNDLLALTPKELRESPEAKTLSNSLNMGSSLQSLKTIRDFVTIDINAKQGEAVSSSEKKTIEDLLKELKISGSVQEAYLVDLNLKMTLSKDYMGMPKGTVAGDKDTSFGSGVFVAKVNDRWFLL